MSENPKIGLEDPYRRKRPPTSLNAPPQPPSKRGRDGKPPIAIEVCCGAAGLSCELKKAGFSVKPIDWQGNRHQPQIPYLRIDLCSEEGQQQIWKLLRCDNIAYVHCAPPCGTFSKARNIPIPEWQLAKGVPNVRPLRDQQFPEGLPADRITMTATERIKVDKGNQIARLCAEVLEFCLKQGITASVENPSGSFLWDTPGFRALAPRCVRVDFHACMHGADRDKKTTLLCSDNAFATMRKKCDRSHAHKPWGVDIHSSTLFRTAEECEYPQQMCHTMAALAAAKAGTQRQQAVPTGHAPPSQTRPAKVQSISKPDLVAAAHRAQVGVQSKRVRRSEAIPERKPPVWVQLLTPTRVETAYRRLGQLPGTAKKPCSLGDIQLTKGDRVTDWRSEKVWGLCGSAKEMLTWIRVERAWSEEEFFKLAITSKHPAQEQAAVPDESLKVICEILSTDPKLWVLRQSLKQKLLARRRTELQAEQALKVASLPESVAAVVKGKQTLLLEEKLAAHNFGDARIAEECEQGLRLTGKLCHSKSF